MLLEAQNQTGDPFLRLEIEMARIRNKKITNIQYQFDWS